MGVSRFQAALLLAFLPALLLAASALAAEKGSAESELAAEIRREAGKRPPPLREIEAQAVVDIGDFGAKPDEKADQLPAIRKALDAALSAGKPAKIVFKKGVYCLDPPDDESCFELSKAKDLLIEGNGASLLVRNPRSGVFDLDSCERVIVRGFEIDYDPLPFTQGSVVAFNKSKSSCEIRVSPGFPPLDAPNLRGPDVAFLKDRGAPGRQKQGVENFLPFESVSRAGEGLYRVQLGKDVDVSQFSQGDRYVSIGRQCLKGRVAIAWLTHCFQTTFEGVSIYASPGACYVSDASDALNVISCKTLLRKGRWQSTNADGVHCQSNRIGPWIEGCVFEGMSDDGVNVYSTPAHLGGAFPDGFVESDFSDPYRVRPGDRLAAFDPASGSLEGEFFVKQVDFERSRLLLDKPLPRGFSISSEKGAKAVYNMNLAGAGTLVRGNVFRNFRGRGLLLKCVDSVVEGNLFEGVSNVAIDMTNNQDVPEGLQCERLLVAGNKIEACGYDANFNRDNPGAISLIFVNSRCENAKSPGHSGIAICGNSIEKWSGRAISIASAKNVELIGNEIGKPLQQKGGEVSEPVSTVNADSVSMKGNLLAGRPLSKDKKPPGKRQDGSAAK